ncbi:ankyrin, partial [Peniophora sp. CONT]
LLLANGALIEDADDCGDTPLHVAAYHGRADVVRLLLEHQTTDSVESGSAMHLCRARNRLGQTALHYAAKYGHANVCIILLEHGTLVNDPDNDGNTPLHLA